MGGTQQSKVPPKAKGVTLNCVWVLCLASQKAMAAGESLRSPGLVLQPVFETLLQTIPVILFFPRNQSPAIVYPKTAAKRQGENRILCSVEKAYCFCAIFVRNARLPGAGSARVHSAVDGDFGGGFGDRKLKKFLK